MKKLLVAGLIIFLILGLTGCSSASKQGKITSVPVSFSMNDLFGGSVQKPVYGNTVNVKTDDGKQVTATWDKKLLGRPVDVKLTGMAVTIEPTDNPKTWKVTKINSK